MGRGSKFLPVIEENCLEGLQRLLPRWLADPADPGRTRDLTQLFRQGAIASLLRTGSVETFQRRLQRSGGAYLVHLAAAPQAEQRRSRALPFFDALAAGDETTARAIAARTTDRWDPNVEAEDDYLYVHAAMRWLDDAPRPEKDALLIRWETCLQGDEDLRLEAFRALHAGDADLLASHLDTHTRGLAREAKDDDAAIEFLTTEAVISVEALATLALASRAGRVVLEGVRAAPGLALGLPAGSWSRDSYLTID
jgi:hypothetical protein